MPLTPTRKYGGYLIASGDAFDIIAAVTENDDSPFWDYFQDVHDKAMEAIARGKKTKESFDYQTLQYYFNKFSGHGSWNNIVQLRSLGDGFFEFKNVDTGLRVPFYYDDRNRRVIILTHYFEKQKGKTPAEELDRMKKIKERFDRARRG